MLLTFSHQLIYRFIYLIFNSLTTMKQLFILMLLLFSCALGNAQQKAPVGRMPVNFAEQEAIVKKFTNSFDSLTPMQQIMFFTNVKHIMDPEVTKIEPGKIDSDPPSDAIDLFNGKDLNEWEEVAWGRSGPGGKKPITWIIKAVSYTHLTLPTKRIV